MPIGADIQLPNHIKKSRSITGLTRDEFNNHDINDNLCLFRCLQLYLGAPIHALEGPTNCLKERLEEHAGKSVDDGVEVSMLPIIEDCFNISINVYSLQEDKTANVIQISDRNDTQENQMHLNLYKNHFSYIANSNHLRRSTHVQTVLEW